MLSPQLMTFAQILDVPTLSLPKLSKPPITLSKVDLTADFRSSPSKPPLQHLCLHYLHRLYQSIHESRETHSLKFRPLNQIHHPVYMPH